MKQWQRLFFYLVINILVSACTTVGVLFVWDQVYGPLPRGLLPSAFERTQASTPAPQTAAPEAPAEIQPIPTESFMVHQVISGETFESIAQNYNVSVEELLAVNGFSKSQPLGEGEVLRIPVNPKGSVIIERVVAAGDLEREMVVLKHRGRVSFPWLAGVYRMDRGTNLFSQNFPN